MTARPTRTTLAALALLGVAACTEAQRRRVDREAQADSAAALVVINEPRELAFTAHDFYYDGPLEVPAGFLRIRFTNDGEEIHQLQLFRLAEGRNAGDFLLAAQEGRSYAEFATPAGGINIVDPGRTGEVTQLLEPGEYVVACLNKGRDGNSHLVQGMARPLTVTRRRAQTARPPEPDVRMTLVDYNYDLDGPLKAGRTVMRIGNAGKQAHEVLLFRIAEGKRMTDFITWYDNQQGPAPGALIGGVPAIEPGQEATVAVDLEPGVYALYCLIPDSGDGRPHVVHGMMREIVVQ